MPSENCSAVGWAEQFSGGQEGGNRRKKDQPTLQETGNESDIEKSGILKFKEKKQKENFGEIVDSLQHKTNGQNQTKFKPLNEMLEEGQ